MHPNAMLDFRVAQVVKGIVPGAYLSEHFRDCP